MADAAVGKYFDSYDSLKSFVKDYEQINFVQLSVDKSRKLETQKAKSVMNTKLGCSKSDLMYSSIKYKCIHGGKFKSQGNGNRKTNTFKQECPFTLKVNLSADKQRLKISELVPSHNHEVSESIFKSLPRQRTLDSEERKKVQQMLSLKCNKKFLKEHIVKSTGKNVILKDIHNMKIQKNNNLEETVKFLKSQGYVEVVADNTKKLVGIFFQSKEMKEAFDKNPELLILDATYCLNSLRMPLYVLLVINGNGNGQVAGLFLLSQETSENITTMLNIFKKLNPEKCDAIEIVFTDKDFTERNSITKVFPAASLLLCFFHTLKTFRTNVTAQKMGLTIEQREQALIALQKLAYSRDELNYEDNYKTFLSLGCEKLIEYYNKNWHSIRYEWVRGFIKTQRTFNVTTPNNLESLNQKIKDVVTRNSDLLSFFKDLMTCLESIHNEQKHKAINLLLRKPTQLKEGSVEKFFEETLTPYAWEMVSKEVEEASKMEFCFDINAKIDKCDCVFFINSNLPCRHILFKRKEAGITLTTKEIIPNKFTREGHYGTFCNNPLTFETALPVPINILSPVSTRVLTKQEKYKKAIQVCSDIASIVSDYGSKHFERALEELLKYKSNLLENNYLLDSVLVEKLEDDVLPTENVELGELSSDNMVEEVALPENTNRLYTRKIDSDITGLGGTVVQSSVATTSPDFSVHTLQEENKEEEQGIEDQPADDTLNPTKSNRINLGDISLDNLTLKRKGRPKGVDTTVVGLKKKKIETKLHPTSH